MVRNCANNQSVFQEFLLNCPYDEIRIADYTCSGETFYWHYSEPYNLFDYTAGENKRFIFLSELDKLIDTEEDFLTFVDSCSWIDQLAIKRNRPVFENTILETYSSHTLKAYIWRFNHVGLRCLICNDPETPQTDAND